MTSRARISLLAATALLLALAASAQYSPLGAGIMAYHNRDYDKAMRVLRPLADAGDREAQMLVGEMLVYGQGVSKDLAAGRIWLEKSAGQGDPDAMALIGDLLLRGEGTKKDPEAALAWLKRAALAGQSYAAWAVGFAYQQGQGVPPDPCEAKRWYQLAAKVDDPAALTNLGFMLYRGDCGEKRPDQALQFFQRAASLGSANAALNLAILYHKGEDPPKDDYLAYKWCLIATLLGETPEKVDCEGIGALTPEQKEIARKAAQKWIEEELKPPKATLVIHD